MIFTDSIHSMIMRTRVTTYYPSCLLNTKLNVFITSRNGAAKSAEYSREEENFGEVNCFPRVFNSPGEKSLSCAAKLKVLQEDLARRKGMSREQD